MANPSIITHSFTGNATELVNAVEGVDLESNGLTFGTGYFSNSNGAVYIPNTTKGTTNYLRVPTITFEPEMTLEFYLKPNGWTLTNNIVDDGTFHRFFNNNNPAPATAYIYSFIQNTQGIHFDMYDTNGNYNRLTVNSSSLNDGVYSHLAFTWSALNNKIKIFKDGAEVGSVTPSTPLVISGLTTFSPYIGSSPTDVANYGMEAYYDGIIITKKYMTSFPTRNNKRRYLNDIN